MTEIENGNEKLRIFVTGSCDGLAEVLDALKAHDELELVGSAEMVQEAAAALAGGHNDVILHATRGPPTRPGSWPRCASTRGRRSSWSRPVTAPACSKRLSRTVSPTSCRCRS